MASKIPVCVAGLIRLLEMCLDASARHPEGMPTHVRKQWAWLDAALATPAVELACEKLDGKTISYMDCLLRDYQQAVFPERESDCQQPDLFALAAG